MTTTTADASARIPAGLCGIFFGALGIHKFILGYTPEGLIMLGISLLTGGLGSPLMGLLGLVEGVIYLTMSDEEFVNTYVLNKKAWL
jgi:TM2 domain-containing membrane protein YozV